MNSLITVTFDRLISGDYFHWFVGIANQYFPYGTFWWVLGFLIFFVFQQKTKNLAYAGLLLAFYLVAMSVTGLNESPLSALYMQTSGLVIALAIATYLWHLVGA